jgi:hypothetical protein
MDLDMLGRNWLRIWNNSGYLGFYLRRNSGRRRNKKRQC